MIIFLYGEDTYRSRRKLEEIVAHYKEIHKSGLNLKYLDGKNADLSDVKGELQTASMFKEKKLLKPVKSGFLLSRRLIHRDFFDLLRFSDII